jgi:hypothetical protein
MSQSKHLVACPLGGHQVTTNLVPTFRQVNGLQLIDSLPPQPKVTLANG